jgi:hypothetical protein
MQNNILKFYFLKLIPQATKGSLKNFLYFIILNKLKSFIILVKTQSKQIKQRKKIMPEFDKNLGCYRLPPLKEISSPRFEEARMEKGFGVSRWLPPLKETFVGSLGV